MATISENLQILKEHKKDSIENQFKEKKQFIKQIEESFNTLFMAKAWLRNSYIHLFYQEDESEKSKQLKIIQMILYVDIIVIWNLIKRHKVF